MIVKHNAGNTINSDSKLVKNLRFSWQAALLCLSILTISACGGSSNGSADDTPPIVTQAPPVLVEPKITLVSFLVMDNPELETDITLQVSGNQITGRVSAKVNLSDLVARVEHTGATLLLDDVTQVNASTANDFRQIRT